MALGENDYVEFAPDVRFFLDSRIFKRRHMRWSSEEENDTVLFGCFGRAFRTDDRTLDMLRENMLPYYPFRGRNPLNHPQGVWLRAAVLNKAAVQRRKRPVESGRASTLVVRATEAGQVNVVHVLSSNGKTAKFPVRRRSTGRVMDNDVAHSLLVFANGFLVDPPLRHGGGCTMSVLRASSRVDQAAHPKLDGKVGIVPLPLPARDNGACWGRGIRAFEVR